jgi:hypothetical protein
VARNLTHHLHRKTRHALDKTIPAPMVLITGAAIRLAATARLLHERGWNDRALPPVARKSRELAAN